MRLLIASVLFVALASAEIEIQAAGTSWRVQEDRRDDLKPNAYLGRDALWLRNNTHAITGPDDFVDGTIEFDWAPLPGCDFFAVQFRRESFTAHENIYFRPSKSGEFDSMQYAPRIGGMSTWQLYPEFNKPAEMSSDQWTRVRLELRGSLLEVYLDDSDKPAFVVARLRSDAEKGGISVWSRIGRDPNAWSAAVSNLRIQKRTPVAKVHRPALSEGLLADWEISAAPLAAIDSPTQVPAVEDWRAIEPEEGGLVNLNRAYGRNREAPVAVARTVLRRSKPGLEKLWVGYSDQVTVFLNGRPLYSATNGWESRYPRYLGWVDAKDESVFLPLQAGDNELVYVVRDDQRFGWGFSGRLENMPGR